MFSHVFIGIADFDRALAFSGPLMAALGLEARNKPCVVCHDRQSTT